jgi:DNA polymerase III subunit epsilon
MIKNILIVDTETTGLNPGKDKLIEIGALLFNLEHKTVLQTWSTLLPCDINPVQHINNIDPVWTRKFIITTRYIEAFGDMAYGSDLIVAHNAHFDRQFLIHPSAPLNTEIRTILAIKRWACTRSDFLWPVPLSGRKLQNVCESMGVPYVNAHRALADCQFLADCFVKIPDLQERFNRYEL